jgi:hypothetical protein
MATNAQMPDELLAPGDLVDVEYLIQPGAAPGLVTLAIHDIKRALAADERFLYQSSWIETRVDKTGQFGAVVDVEFLIVRVQVADPAKRAALPDGYEPQPQWTPERQEAGIPRLSVRAFLALVIAAGAPYSAALVYQSYITRRNTVDRIAEVERIRQDPTLSDDEKRAAFEAIGQAGSSSSLGLGVAAFGGSLVTAAIVIGVLWALSLSGRRGGPD